MKIHFTDDSDSPIRLVSNISPVIGLPKYLGEEISIHLAYNVDTHNYVFDKTFTAIQNGENLKWSDTLGNGSSFTIQDPVYNQWQISLNFSSNYISFLVKTSGGENYAEVTEFSINGVSVTQRE